jgi:MarR family transcriptional regulator, transcriptional regulator for hemolysin
MRPTDEPIGLEVARTGRVISKAFNDALTAAGGSLAQWLVVATLKQREHSMQRDLADAIGIEGATLTHHLNRMEDDGLLRRERVAGNRRNQLVVLTPTGEELFATLLEAVIAFDRRLRVGITAKELDAVRPVLERLRTNVLEDVSEPRR